MRRRNRWWWLRNVTLSMIAGILISAFFISRWEQVYAESAVTVLGSGDGLSVLVEIESARILIVAGNDPSEFANALASARPGQTPRIDLIVVTPGATRIATRAIGIADPARVLLLESPLIETEVLEANAQTTVVSSISTVVIKDHASLEIDPGFSVSTANAGWSIRIKTGSGDLLISERAPLAVVPALAAIVIAGPDAGVLLPSDTPRLVSNTIPISNTEGIVRIAPGETRRIDLGDSRS